MPVSNDQHHLIAKPKKNMKLIENFDINWKLYEISHMSFISSLLISPLASN